MTLELREVVAGYGPFRALFGVSLAVGRGEAVALFGPNGAGKTTVARVATGLLATTSGQVVVGGRDHTGARAWRFVRSGIAHVPEGRSVFATLTVEENLTLWFGRSLGRGERLRSGLEQAFETFPHLARRRRQLAGTLSGGEQRMLALSRVLVEGPEVLVADELSFGLAPIVVDEVYAALAGMRSRGTALLVVEQHVAHALDLCDRAVLMDHGTIAWEAPSPDARARLAATSAFNPGS